MFRVVRLEYLPVVRASLATREMMLLLWQQTVDIMRSGAYMRVSVTGIRGHRIR